MIYTLTLNPAIDYVMQVENFAVGKIHKTDTAEICFGGKGINVSKILGELEIPSVALGFVAGFVGEAIENGIKSQLVTPKFTKLECGMSRINVKLRSGNETDINCVGPEVNEADIERLYKSLDTLQSGDILILSGSVPKGVPTDIYGSIMERLSQKGIMFIVDAEGEQLLNALKYNPFLIKPNFEELCGLFGEVLSEQDIVDSAGKLQKMGAENVLVSLGPDGALLLDSFGQVHRVKAVSGKAVNTVGAGDSMVAGFVAGYIERKDFDYALKLGIATGSATAFSVGLADKKLILQTLEKLK